MSKITKAVLSVLVAAMYCFLLAGCVWVAVAITAAYPNVVIGLISGAVFFLVALWIHENAW